MKPHPTLLLIAVIALVAIAAGCGSDSDGGESPGGAQSGSAAESQSNGAEDDSSSSAKTTFVEKANAACTQAKKGAFERVGAYARKHRSEGMSESELAEDAIKAALLATLQVEIAAIRSLSAPAEDDGEIEEIVADMQATLDQARGMRNVSDTEIEALFGNADKQLEAYGLTACSKSA